MKNLLHRITARFLLYRVVPDNGLRYPIFSNFQSWSQEGFQFIELHPFSHKGIPAPKRHRSHLCKNSCHLIITPKSKIEKTHNDQLHALHPPSLRLHGMSHGHDFLYRKEYGRLMWTNMRDHSFQFGSWVIRLFVKQRQFQHHFSGCMGISIRFILIPLRLDCKSNIAWHTAVNPDWMRSPSSVQACMDLPRNNQI